jgi:TetR/AcrR family transcriptional repressor of nem operon
MGKAEQTKQLIVARAASLFNQQGYSGTSISDLMQATGLQKGGIYNHFQGKDDLALHAFDYAYGIQRDRNAQVLRKFKGDPKRQMLALIELFASDAESPPVPGGCPLLNTAIESDDGHPALRARTQQAMDEWRETIRRLVTKGQSQGVFRPEADGDFLASLCISLLEGALMLTRLYSDPIHVQRAADHLRHHLETHLFQEPSQVS